jgi:predicted RNA-binding Zn ribbon-like protein
VKVQQVGESGVHRFDLCGGHLALDFTNTLTHRQDAVPTDHLTSFTDLVAFFEQSGSLPPVAARGARRWSEQHPGLAKRLLASAIELREALYRIFAGVVEAKAPSAADLRVLNAWIARRRLDESFAWAWSDGEDGPDAFLAPLVERAVDLLTGDQRSRVKLCEADDCVWLFLDASKNKSRRWCDMNQCGNRVKARRFYERSKR